MKTLKKYTAIDSFHNMATIIAFDSLTALKEAKKALKNDIYSLTLIV